MSDEEPGRAAVARPLLTIALAALILSPLARSAGWDSFPISSYPMFSRGDLGHVLGLAHVVLVLADGTRRPAPPAAIGTPEPMIAMSIVRANIDRGSAAGLCASIAERVSEAVPFRARAGELEGRSPSNVNDADVVAVEVVTSFFDTRRYFSKVPDAREPLQRELHARCNVVR